MIDRAKLREVVRCNILILCRTLFPNGRKVSGEWRIGDVMGNPGMSLGIKLVGENAWLWIDRATGQSGNFLDLVMARFGIDFLEAADRIGRTLGISFEISEEGEKEAGGKKEVGANRSVASVSPVTRLSSLQLKRMAEAAHRLAKDPRQIFNVLGSRPEISLDTVRGAALDGDLGFEADCRFHDLSGPAILFGYSLGLKARWPADLLGKRHFRWIAGGPGGQCWRQSLLRSDHLTLCIYEGETDVLSALSDGVENDDTVLAVGLAGAQILPDPRPFAGKEVIIVPDPGEAGARSSGKLKALLEPLAQSVTVDEGGLAE